MNLSILRRDAKIQDLAPALMTPALMTPALTPPFETRWAPLPDELKNPARHANRLKKEKMSLSKRLEALEDDIAEREDEKARASAALLDEGVHANPDLMRQLAGELAELEQAMAELMERWEGLSGEIESLDEALESIADR